VVFVFGGKFWLSNNQNKKNPVQDGVKDFCGKNAPFVFWWKFPHSDNGDYCQNLIEFLNFYTFG
jgi:hypothetical protein